MIYHNPVIPGFHPDPSVCRVGEDYYLVTSSFEYFPGVPLFHSKDLINWRQIGYCLTRKSQLELNKCNPSSGIWAPTIRHHNGRFYMTTTNKVIGKNFFVWTDDITGEWSEPIWVDQGGIDPSFFFDDDGKVYYQSTGLGGIQQCEIDIETGEMLTESIRILKGANGYTEGPHLYKINGMYYLMTAEGGTFYGHMETIWRGDNPWGPFEPCPDNPILTHRNRTSRDIQGTGHADFIQAHDGSWWMVFLAFRPANKRAQHLGRETFIAPVEWTDDGWPIVYNHGWVDLEMEAKTLKKHTWPNPPSRDDFNSDTLSLQWNYLRNPYPENYSLTERPGWIRLKGSKLTLNDHDSPAFIGRRQQHFDCRAATLLDFEPQSDNEEAGLTAIMNAEHHYEIAVTRIDKMKYVIVRRRIGDLVSIVAEQPVPSGPIRLEITANKGLYTFSYAPGNEPSIQLATGSTRYLSAEVANTFTGVFLGIYATGSGKKCKTPADFDWFDYETNE